MEAGVVASDRSPAPAAVLVLGGDAVVGRALELLLRSADCDIRFLAEPSRVEPGLLDGFGLLLLAPGLSAGCREALLALVGVAPVAARIPVLELNSSAEGAPEVVGAGPLLVPWPCQPEDLQRRIKAALLAGSEAGGDGGDKQSPARSKERER